MRPDRPLLPERESHAGRHFRLPPLRLRPGQALRKKREGTRQPTVLVMPARSKAWATPCENEEFANLFCNEVVASGECGHIHVFKPDGQRLVMKKLWA